MRIRTAFAAAALGTLVAFGGATAAHADIDDQSGFGITSEENMDWQAPATPDQGGAGFGSEGNMEEGQGQGFDGADASFLQ